MILRPSVGMAFIREDKREFNTKLEIPEDAKKGVGTTGVIVAVTNVKDYPDQYNIGDHVVFSKFNEQICIYEDGKEYIFFSVPVQSILGFLS